MIKSILVFVCVLSLTACSSAKPKETLFEQLNGKRGIENIVNHLIKGIAKDKQVFPYFAKASVSHFREGFITHLCAIAGGPCIYRGDNMIDIHTGMKINEADFNRVVELLINAMEASEVGYSTQNQVLALLAPLRQQIIKI